MEDKRKNSTQKIRKDEMQLKLFTKIALKLQKSNVYENLIDCLAFNLKYESIETEYQRTKYLYEEASRSNYYSKYEAAFTVLKRLGFVSVKQRYICLNPFINTNLYSKKYEAVVAYYSNLWELTENKAIYFHGNFIQNIEDLKLLTIDVYKANRNKVDFIESPVESSIPTQELYNWYFYNITNYVIDNMNLRDINIMRATIRSMYTQLGTSLAKEIAYIHFLMLEEQQVCKYVEGTKNVIEFANLPTNFKCIPFEQTEAYKTQLLKESENKSMLTYPSFEDIQAYLY